MSSTPISTANPSTLQTQQTNLRYLLNIIKDEVKREINCHAVGTIQTFDPTTLTCTVSFNYQKVMKQSSFTAPDPTSYVDTIINYPTLVRVPIIVLGGGGAFLTFPISGVVTNSQGQITYPGDTCLLLFCDRDIDLWLELGGKNNPPNTERMHDLSDAVAIIGLYPTGANLNPPQPPIANYNTQQVVLTDISGPRLPPSGGMMVWPGASAPAGWLLCQGQSLSTTTYPFIFAAIGYVYGGSGSSFNLPDMQGNVAAGYKSGDPNFGTLGVQVGEALHVLTPGELPAGIYGTDPASIAEAGGTQLAPGNYATIGMEEGHNTIQPSLTLNWIIKI